MAQDEGYIRTQAPIKPNNDNPRAWSADASEIKGAPIICPDIDTLIAHHPNRMVKGSMATIYNYPSAGTITEYRLSRDPAEMLDSSGNSIITLDNFTQFWEQSHQVLSASNRVYQYSADGPGGGAPVYPYTLGTESAWVNTFDKNQGHRWMRFRDDDVDLDEDTIFDNWTVPIPINSAFSNGDYLENRFRRQDVSATVHTAAGTLSLDLYYSVESGRIQIDGDLSLNDIGQYGVETTAVLTIGRIFKYAAGNTYDFQDSASVVETLKPPPRTVNGLPNNEPVGWEDTVPAGTEQLWKITGQKSVYQQLKSDWIIEKVIENPNYTRYSEAPSPHPDTIVDTNTSAEDGTGGDTALEAAGWNAVYAGQSFIARREDDLDGPDDYTPWLVEKISEESGEYTDRVFKLFSINLDADSPSVIPPVKRDPSDEGWFDTPQIETDTEINYVSEARKFFNGELKTSWSAPVPYTGKDSFNDVITSDLGDNFKYDADDNVDPAQITLQADLYKGTSKLWENAEVDISYIWRKVYDNGSVVDIAPTTNPADDFYLLGAALPIRADQRVVVKPGAVNGNAVFRCTQTITFPEGDPLIFVEEFSILDITDGKDARDLSLSAENDRVLWDTGGSVFSPLGIVLRAYQSNLVSPTYYWYKKNGVAWDSLTGNPDFDIAGNILTFDPVDVFASDATGEEITIAVSTHATNPASADYIDTFSDYRTIVKLSAAATGTPGENALAAILSNEAHIIQLDPTTGEPPAGETGNTGRAQTKLEVYNGQTPLIYGVGNDYEISVSSDEADVVFDFEADGDNARIFIDSWDSPARAAVCTILITYGALTLTKKFSIASALDAPGAVILDVDSDKGFVFTPDDKTNKTFTARLYDTSADPQLIALPDAAYTFRWRVNNIWGSLNTTNYTKVISVLDISTFAEVTVEVYKDAALYRSRTIAVSDVNDGRSYRAWTDAAAVSGAQKLTTQDPSTFGAGITVSGVTWRLSTDAYWNTHTVIFVQDGQSNGAGWIWTAPYKVKGETGSQGVNGGFFFKMYKASATSPALGAGGQSSTLAQMTSAGWTGTVPASGVIWQTERAWIGDAVVFTGGLPSTGPMSGSQWTVPLRLSGSDGTTPDDGEDGNNGWTPVHGVVPDGPTREVHQLIDWIGGEGTKPGHIGEFVGSTGFVPTAALARNIRGTDGTDGVDGVGEMVFQQSGAAIVGSNVNVTFSDLGVGKFLVYLEIEAYDSGVNNFFGMTRQFLMRKTGVGAVDYLYSTISIMGDGFSPTLKPTINGSRLVFVNATAGFNSIVVQAFGITEAGGYQTPASYRVMIIKLKS